MQDFTWKPSDVHFLTSKYSPQHHISKILNSSYVLSLGGRDKVPRSYKQQIKLQMCVYDNSGALWYIYKKYRY
jgi:hypothetical protein